MLRWIERTYGVATRAVAAAVSHPDACCRALSPAPLLDLRLITGLLLPASGPLAGLIEAGGRVAACYWNSLAGMPLHPNPS